MKYEGDIVWIAKPTPKYPNAMCRVRFQEEMPDLAHTSNVLGLSHSMFEKYSADKVLVEARAETERVRKEYLDYKVHYDRIFEKSIVVPTEEYAARTKLFHRLSTEGGCIVSSADCCEMEIADARSRGDMFVDATGIGFIRRLPDWLQKHSRYARNAEPTNCESSDK